MYVRQTCVCTYEGLLAYVLSFEATYVCICTYVFIVTGRSVKVARRLHNVSSKKCRYVCS